MTFSTRSRLLAVAALAAFATVPATAHDHAKPAKPAKATKAATPMAAETIAAKAASLPDFSTLVTAVQAAGLVDTLNSAGPFTVFAPTNAAFGKLPAGTVATLVRPENKGTLTTVLTYHVVPGRILAADVVKAVKAGGGKASLTTVQGGKLTAQYDRHGALVLMDEKGGTSKITATDINQSNGVIHVIDTVVMPG